MNNYTNLAFEGVTLTETLPSVLKCLLEAPQVGSRNGYCQELLMPQLHFTNPAHNPYITTYDRKANVVAQMAETVWVLTGRDDIAFLEPYLPRAKDFSDDGTTWRGAYGPRLRRWSSAGEPGVDQLEEVIQMLAANPEDRRAVMQLFDPARDLAVNTKDVPCNNWLHFLVRNEELHLHVSVRSNDVIWGLSGINYTEWTMLMQLVAFRIGVNPGSLTFSTSSLHLYEHHTARASNIVSATKHREPLSVSSPGVAAGVPRGGYEQRKTWAEQSLRGLENFILTLNQSGASMGQAQGEYYRYVQKTSVPFFHEWAAYLLVHRFPELFDLLENSSDTALHAAFLASPGVARRLEEAKESAGMEASSGEGPRNWTEEFMSWAGELHEEKNQAYGDSWRKRGEAFSIIPNLARKVDRLGLPGAGDSELDTVTDLLLYLAKYDEFLMVQQGYMVPSALVGDVHHHQVMARVQGYFGETSENPGDVDSISQDFDKLTKMVESRRGNKAKRHLAQDLAVRVALRAVDEYRRSQLAKQSFNGYDV